jgi:hypothetical protein
VVWLSSLSEDGCSEGAEYWLENELTPPGVEAGVGAGVEAGDGDGADAYGDEFDGSAGIAAAGAGVEEGAGGADGGTLLPSAPSPVGATGNGAEFGPVEALPARVAWPRDDWDEAPITTAEAIAMARTQAKIFQDVVTGHPRARRLEFPPRIIGRPDNFLTGPPRS